MKQNLISTSLIAALITVSLIAELSQFFYIDAVCIPFLTSFYYALINHHSSTVIIMYSFIAHLLQSFCCYGLFYLPLIHIAPLTFIHFYTKRFFYPSFLYGPCIALTAGLIGEFVVEKQLLMLNPANNYTLIKMSSILIMNISFSLIIRNWGGRDNRSMT